MTNEERIIYKSQNDKKNYVAHKLKNGMKCVIIKQHEYITCANSVTKTNDNEDSLSDSSYSSNEEDNKGNLFALCLNINVGSFSDPLEAQGLAHLMEHMILMGSERYPKVNYLEQFINRKNGYSNAQTGCENTIYYFEVPTEYSKETLDIFASMFQAPKLAKESIDKEKQVVDSEFNMSIPIDDNRIERFVKFDNRILLEIIYNLIIFN